MKGAELSLTFLGILFPKKRVLRCWKAANDKGLQQKFESIIKEKRTTVYSILNGLRNENQKKHLNVSFQ
jgi:hypothetical protein